MRLMPRSVLPVLALLPLLAGCARVPALAPVEQIKHRLTVDFTVAGHINPLYYYFIAIDAQGDPSLGPLPVVSSPWGNGWGTGNITHYVLYHQGVFTVNQVRANTNLLLSDQIGIPFETNQPEGGNLMHVVLDLDTIATNLTRINLNLITTDHIDVEPNYQSTKPYDALGMTGNSFLNLPVNVSNIFTNSQSLDPETAGDLPPQSSSETRNDLDLTDWTIDVRSL
ncbi:MAG TPA: hypothetical protein VHR86_06755 [Armatimonadota bacterium]|nr:hypothetical protein [Armatimonadota bacterium]